LIGFPESLEPKFLLNNQNVVKIALTQTLTLGILHSWSSLFITRRQIKLESCSNHLKMGKIVQFAIKKAVSDLDV